MKRLEPTWIVTVSRLVHYMFLVTAQNGDPVLAYASLSLAIENLRTTLLKNSHSAGREQMQGFSGSWSARDVCYRVL